MTSLNLAGTMILAVAEAAGAYWFFKTKSVGLRMLMTSFGFGFAFAIVLFDLLPDATEHYPMGYPLFALGALIMFGVWRFGKQRLEMSPRMVAVPLLSWEWPCTTLAKDSCLQP